MTNDKVKKELEELFFSEKFDIKPILKKVWEKIVAMNQDFPPLKLDEKVPAQKVDPMKKVIDLLVGRTIVNVEFISSRANNDTMVLTFTDGSNIKIASDPNCVFDGLSFYVSKKKTVEQEYDEEIK